MISETSAQVFISFSSLPRRSPVSPELQHAVGGATVPPTLTRAASAQQRTATMTDHEGAHLSTSPKKIIVHLYGPVQRGGAQHTGAQGFARPRLSAKIGVASLVAKTSWKSIKISRKRENGHYNKNPRKNASHEELCAPHSPHSPPWGPMGPPQPPMGPPQPLIGPHGGFNGADGPRLAPDRRQSP